MDPTPAERDPFADAVRQLSTLRDFIRFAVTRFTRADVFFGHGTATAWDEAVYLCQHTLGLPLDLLEPFLDARLLDDERQAIADVLRRRIDERVPAAYLTGEAWLGDLRFRVDPRVIVPRSYIAEILREDLAPLGIDEDRVQRVLDLCTGSGCLAIVAALRFPGAQVDAVELSPDALAVARTNVEDYALSGRLSLLEGDLYQPLKARSYDLILTNPPYVDARAMAALPAEYLHEPTGALAGGEDGLDLVRTILAEAPRHLSPGGQLLMEVGNSRDALEAAFPQLPFTWIETTAPVSSVCLLAREDLVPKDQAPGRKRPRAT
ncbi:MAG: 50S ribosomal protein L3 N(5)-glutamine methyltransferase [Burkholderiales bacterium]|nr:50S ribosomal protein L3 N(5)-glutamine methyltransferase [Burkholderiales bacterium]